MTFLINNKPAVVKSDTTIEYVSSNLLFDDREDFSLSFDLPLRGCKENREIFADIYRKDVNLDTLFFDAEIYSGKFHVSGAIAIVGVNDDSVKVQFLRGRSFKNFYVDWDTTFIDELDLGDYHEYASLTNHSPAVMWGNGDVIALPWVNNQSGNLQNKAEKVNGTWQWHTTQTDDNDSEVVKGLSCQLRLYALVQKICTAVGYSFDGAPWAADSEWYNLYMLNTIPNARGERTWAAVLPHWSLNEFFSELEKLLIGEFDIDHKRQHIAFSFKLVNQGAAGDIAIDDVLDEFSVDVDKDDKSEYHGTMNTGYAACDHELWNFYSCYWYFHKHPNVHVQVYQTLQALMNHLHNDGPNKGRTSGGITNDQWLLYATDVDSYFVIVAKMRKPTDESGPITLYGSAYELRPLNRFGDWICDDKNYSSKEEIKFVPAWLDLCLEFDENDTSGWSDITLGKVLFLDPKTSDNEATSGNGHHPRPSSREEAQEWQTEVNQVSFFTTQIIERGETEASKGYYDKIFVGFWYGEPAKFGNYLPAPWIDQFEVMNSWDYNSLGNNKHKIVGNYSKITSDHDGTLRINNSAHYAWGPTRDAMTKIDQKKKYEFSFIARELPNVRARFLIRGKWYLCSQIQCQVDANGLNPVMKGTFWRITG